MNSKTLLTMRAGVFLDATVLEPGKGKAVVDGEGEEGAGPYGTFVRMREAVEEVLAAREAGRVECRGVEWEELTGRKVSDGAFVDEEGRLMVPPKCEYCEFAEICARGGVR